MRNLETRIHQPVQMVYKMLGIHSETLYQPVRLELLDGLVGSTFLLVEIVVQESTVSPEVLPIGKEY